MLDKTRTPLALDSKRLDAAKKSLDQGAVLPNDSPYR